MTKFERDCCSKTKVTMGRPKSPTPNVFEAQKGPSQITLMWFAYQLTNNMILHEISERVG